MLNWRRVLIATAAVLAVAWSVYIWSRSGHKFDTINAVWGVIGGIVTLVMALVAWVDKPPNGESLRDAADDRLERLAYAVEIQWREEAEIRGLARHLPLAVRWRAADPGLADRPSTVLNSPVRNPAQYHAYKELLEGEIPRIAQTFQSLPLRRLVVVGEPGAGKTVLALLLTLDLLRSRRPGDPVPVLIPIASWNPGEQHLHKWMAAWLEETYVWLRTPAPTSEIKLAEWLIKRRQIIPILDGLDEMTADLRASAIDALNRVLTVPSQADSDAVVLTCRTKEYTEIVDPAETHPAAVGGAGSYVLRSPFGPLAGAAVIELQPPGVSDIQRYLRETTPHRQVSKWDDLLSAMQTEPGGQLARALSTPLMIAMARTAYSHTANSPNELLDAGMTERANFEQHLLDQLIPAVYPTEPNGPEARNRSRASATKWLGTLALHLERQSTLELAWWELGQLLSNRIYWGFYAVLAGIVGSVAFEAMAGPVPALAAGLIVAIVGPIIGFLVGVSPPFIVTIRLRAGLPRFARGFVIGLAIGIALELVLGLPLRVGILAGTAVGLVGGAASGLEFLLEQPADSARAANPYSVLVSDRKALLIRVLGVGPLGGLAVGLAIGLKSDLGIERGLRVGIVIGLALFLGASVVIGFRTKILVGLVAGAALGGTGTLLGYLALRHTTASTTQLCLCCGVCLWLEIALALFFTSAWGHYLLGRAWPTCNNQLPYALIPFLDDAYKRGVLRQTGATYQFRHAALQARLAARSGPGS